MPSESIAQQGMMGADLARLRKGQKTETGMSEKQLEDFAGTPTKGLPMHKHKKHSPPKHGRSAKPRGGGNPY
jgi:Protein of unknwon function (DUF3008)